MSDVPLPQYNEHHQEPEREQFSSLPFVCNSVAADTDNASTPTPEAMRFLPDASSFCIQRWIGSRHSSPPVETVCAQTRQKLHGAECEMEEFEREVSLSFVMRDLQLDLEATVTPHVEHAMTPWLRSQSSSATLQPLQLSHAPNLELQPSPSIASSPSKQLPPTQFQSLVIRSPSKRSRSLYSPASTNSPVTPTSPQSPISQPHPGLSSISSLYSPASTNSPVTPASPQSPISHLHPGLSSIATPNTDPTPTTHHPSPTTPERDRRSSFRSLFRPPTFSYKPSPSVLSLASHFSSCKSSASIASSSSRSPSLKPVRSPSIGSPSSHPRSERNQSHSGHARACPPSFTAPASRRAALPPPTSHHVGPNGSPPPKSLLEIDASGMAIKKKKRRISVPATFAAKKRRLVVRGVAVDDLLAVEGVRRWASGLGELKHVYRAPDGTLWIEFRDRKVANNVCVITAQVYIPHVGRVVLDWAEGRQPG
ncbi:hypothetical protein BU17DRAFT_62139 [Hysterangium stoloniferum]|nr:hypothetical protein BU17DRAFT_62139 [Hysterangium stoloniferum]